MPVRNPNIDEAGQETKPRTGEGSDPDIYRRLFRQVAKGLMILREDPDRGFDIVDANAEALEILGVSPMRSSLDDLPPAFRPLFAPKRNELYRHVLQSGEAWRDEVRVVTDNGERVYTVVVSSLSDRLLVLQIEDATDKARSEKAIPDLRILTQKMHSTFDPDLLLDILIKEALSMLQAECGVAAFCTSEGVSSFRFLRQGNLVPPECCSSDGTLLCRLISHDLPYLSNDPMSDPRVDTQLAERFQVRSVISSPIVDPDAGMIGFVELHNKSTGAFDGLDEEKLAAVSQIAVGAMKNCLAYREVTQVLQQLRENAQRYQLLVEDLNAIVWEADATTWQFSFVSRQAERVLGYPIDQWLVDPHFLVKHMHPDDRDQAVAYCTSAIEKGEDHQLVYRFIAADGRAVWLQEIVRVVRDFEDRPTILRGLLLDITDRVAVEKLLRESESRFRSTFEDAGIGIALISPKGYPLKSNPALQDLLGFTEEEMTTTSLYQLYHPEDRDNDLELFNELMAGERNRYQVEKRFLSKNGSVVAARLVLSLVRNGDRSPQYAIAMIEDLTERKAAEQVVVDLLAKVREDAAELEKRVEERTSQLMEMNEELRSFTYTVSHDLRAPLRAVHGFAEILLGEEDGLSPSGRECLERVLSATQRMDALIQDLLAYSRITQQDLQVSSVSLKQVVEKAVKSLLLEHEGKEIELQVEDGFPEVIGHEGVLTQVVLNLLTNAIKFVSPGVTPRVRVRTREEDGSVRLQVEDNGIGIPKEQQERIFKIFERIHGIDAYPGTGIGLAIVRKGVNRMGGAAGVESEPGTGSVFWIELRKAPQPGGKGGRNNQESSPDS